jgi:hypothetical protein
MPRRSSLSSVPDSDNAAEVRVGGGALLGPTGSGPSYTKVQVMHDDEDDSGADFGDDAVKHTPSPLALVITAVLVILLAHLWQLFLGRFS